MKKTAKLTICAAALLLTAAACTKAPSAASEQEQEGSSSKQHAQTSSIVGYWKDNTPNPAVTGINNNPGYIKEILYTIGPLTVQAADIVSGHLQQQLNFNGNNNAMAVGYMVIGTNANVKDHTSSGFVGYIAKPAGSNLSYADEGTHEVISRNGSFQFTANSSSIYINAVFYGGSTATLPDFTLPGNGEMVAVVERGVTCYSTRTDNLPFSASESKNYVPIDGPTLHRQYSIGPLTVPAQTMVDVRYDVESTSEVPVGYNQRFGRSVIQGTSATATTGNVITRQTQAGITRGEHHATWSHAGGYYYPSSISNAYFNSVTYAYGNWSTEPLYVEPGSATTYGQMILEMRPYVWFDQDLTRNFTSINSTEQVLYSVGPLDIDANQVVEVRYQATTQATAGVTIISKIIRATSPTATTGVTVQPALARRAHPNYVYNTMAQSTAERPSTAQTGQYYNVVVYRTAGASTCPVTDSGELEVVKR